MCSWRAFKDTKQTLPSHGFIDGDFIESLLLLPNASLEEIVSVAKQMNKSLDLTVGQLTNLIDEFQHAK